MNIIKMRVELVGNETGDFIHLDNHCFRVPIDGVEYMGLIKKGSRSDGNSTPYLFSIILKRTGPFIGAGIIHDSLYRDPTVYTISDTPEALRLTRKQCDVIYFYFLRHHTGLFDTHFSSLASFTDKLSYWIMFKRAPLKVVKERIASMIIARGAYLFLRIGGDKIWQYLRVQEGIRRT